MLHDGYFACTWTPKVCKIMTFMAIILGLGLLFYILLGFRYKFSRMLRNVVYVSCSLGLQRNNIASDALP